MKEELIRILKKYAYRHGKIKLSSGEESEHYVNCKPVILTGRGLQLVSEMMLEQIDTPCVAGLTLGADPLVSGVTLVGKGAGLIIRKEPKGHGTQSQVEGPLPPMGTFITVLEDVTTTGESAMKAVDVLRKLDYNVNRVVTIVDRQAGALESMQSEGIELRSLVTLEELI
jgi:orotate phosphoribosyltransferase